MGNLQTAVGTLLISGRSAYCLIGDYLTPQPRSGDGRAYVSPPPTNYSWAVGIPRFQRNRGTSMQDVLEKRFEPYFRLVGEWNLEVLGIYGPGDSILGTLFSIYAGVLKELVSEPLEEMPEPRAAPVCLNKSGKMIATKVYFPIKKSGALYLLPPPTKSSLHDGIEVILDIILGQSATSRPSWWSEVSVPGLDKLQGEARRRKQDIAKLQTEIEAIEANTSRLASFRDLLCEEGTPLEEVVKATLAELGIATERTEPGFPIDLIKGGVAAFEITGVADKIDAHSPKVVQIARFKEASGSGEKVVLIANTHKKTPPAERKGLMDFTPQVSLLLTAQKVCFLTTLDLFNLWVAVKNGRESKERAQLMILETNGRLEVSQG